MSQCAPIVPADEGAAEDARTARGHQSSQGTRKVPRSELATLLAAALIQVEQITTPCGAGYRMGLRRRIEDALQREER